MYVRIRWKESSSGKRSKSNSNPNSSSITFTNVMVATESQVLTVAWEDDGIAVAGSAGNTISKHFVSRFSISSIPFTASSLVLIARQRRQWGAILTIMHSVIQLRTDTLESLSRNYN